MSTNITRQIVLDTETTGINKFGVPYEGHRIIEIGAVEIINRRRTGLYFHVYLKPDRRIDPEAFNIHGISDEFLANQSTFADVVDDFLQFISGSELVIHNAPFDIGFIDYEFAMLNRGIIKTNNLCKVTDSLQLARKIFPGKRNSLDALCDRYLSKKIQRTHHSALLDAEILADVFLLMTGGQTAMCFAIEDEHRKDRETIKNQRLQSSQTSLKIIYASHEETIAHELVLDLIKKNNGSCLWRE